MEKIKIIYWILNFKKINPSKLVLLQNELIMNDYPISNNIFSLAILHLFERKKFRFFNFIYCSYDI